MVTEQQAEETQRGFVGGGIVIAAVLSLAAAAAMLLGETWAVWPLIPLVALEIVFVALWVRRRRSSGARR
ncbi:TIGR04206 family protein [Curtobacterium sp. 9128]|uniref:hypothetical protein n=1 Tax=Curtobacterium sp. 9128 TaxID=1793722 RepID=UPI0007D72439|nr:hypothetical protein [Curtobacterium sp. 9128]SBN61873.1 TIGR04206 family protein [Curtobacterium sp. 9128]